METLLAVVGGLAIVGTLTVIGLKIRTLLLLAQRVRSLAALIQVAEADLDGIAERLERLETKREFSYASEIDGLARKVNALSNYGRTLELTSRKVDNFNARISLLETHLPPAPQNPASVTGTDESSRDGCGCPLAVGQHWAFCGESDMGQTMPALCEDCGGDLKRRTE